MLNWRDKFRLHARAVRQRATALRCATQTALRPSTLDFVRRLSLRYQARATTALPRLAQILPMLRPSLTEQHQRYSINFAPRLSLNLRQVETLFRSYTPAQGGAGPVDRRRARHAEQLVPRIFARAQREEARTAPNGRTTQRVLARPSATQMETTEAQARQRPAQSAPAALIERNATTRAQSFESPQLDVKRLTNEVIQVLDRRIMAERERLGRI